MCVRIVAKKLYPKIIKIIKACDEGELPTDVEWSWGASRVEIMLDNASSNKQVIVKQLLNFSRVLGIENLKTATLRKLYDAEYKTPLQIITITKEQLLELDGVKEKSANKLYNNIQKGYQSASLAQIVVACNLLGGGLGVKTVDSILAEIPDIFDRTNDVSQQLILIPGIQQKTVNKIVPKLESARAYLNIVKNGLSSGDNTIYTCPSGGQAIIKVVNIYNTSAGAITVSTKVLP